MINIQKLSTSEIEEVVALEEELLLETLGSEMLQNELSNPYAHFLVAKDQNKTIGYIGCWCIDGVCEVINFVVDKAYQRQGVGTSLLNSVIDEFHPQEIILEVRSENAQAINFYLKHQFKQIGRRTAYYKNGDDALVLRKEIL